VFAGFTTTITKQTTATAIIRKLTAFWPWKVMGRPVMSSCSLPNAISEPVTVSAPKSTSKLSAAATPVGIAPPRCRYSTIPTSVAARAPKACEKAMNCGIDVISIFIAIG